MKKIILILLVLGLSLTVKGNEQNVDLNKHLFYVETNYQKPTFILNFDKNEINININGFENKTFKFKKFGDPIRSQYYVTSCTNAICDGDSYEILQVYILSTRNVYYLFTNKKTGGTIEYHFG